MMDKDKIVYGKNPVEALLESDKRRINKIFLAKGVKFDEKIRKILNTARDFNITVQEVPREKLNTIAPGAHQGIAASVSPVEYKDFDRWLQDIKNNTGLSLTVILDGVEDPHNLGAIIRTLAAAGGSGIIIPKRRSSQITATVEKASAGTVSKIDIIQVTNLTNTIEKLKENNFWIIGVENTGEKYYFETDFNINCVIVLGGEGQGISALVKKHCDMIVKIPMPGKINSLNVSNAASIVIYEAIRQRISSKTLQL